MPNYTERTVLSKPRDFDQVANFHNNNLRNNFWGGYLINFNNGIPTPEEQGDIERQIKRKFSGTDNAGRFVVTFNDDVSKR